MSDEPGEELRSALRDLLPDYQGPADPFVRVGAAVRRRRRVVRARLAAAGAAAAAVAAVAVGVPALLTSPEEITPGAPRVPLPAAADVQKVASGTVGGLSWSFGSTSLGGQQTRCLYGDGGALRQTLACFPSWQPAQGAAWSVQGVEGGTAVLGVAPVGTPRVTLVLRDSDEVKVTTVRTVTDTRTRFFAVVVAGSREVREVRLFDATGARVAFTDTDPDSEVPCDAEGVACGKPAN